MEIIRKRINLEELKSHSFGLAPYIPVNQVLQATESNETMYSAATGVNGNWGEIICDCTEFNNIGKSTAAILQKYFAVKDILTKGLKLKRITKNSTFYYTTDFTDEVRNKEFIPCDESLFEDLGKGLFKEKGTGTTITYGYIRLVSKEDRDTYFNLGGDGLIVRVEASLLGLIAIPSNIQGLRVPEQFYVSQIPVWLNWFEENKVKVKNEPKDCCIIDEWEERGGDAMYYFLVENSDRYQRELNKWEGYRQQGKLKTPTIEVPILLTQTYDDNGTVSVYEDDTQDFSYNGEIALLNPSAATYSNGFTAESRLKELGTREKVYSSDGTLMPFRWATTAKTSTEIPYKIGELFNVTQTGSNTYIGDYITNIEVDTDEKTIKFEYVFGGNVVDGTTADINGTGGIKYQEAYAYEEKAMEFGTTHLTYKEIDFNNKIFTIYNKDFDLNREVNLSSIIAMTTGDIWRRSTATNAPVFKKEYLNHISEEPKINVDIEIERGGASAFENHFKLSECNTFSDVADYGNNFFNLK